MKNYLLILSACFCPFTAYAAEPQALLNDVVALMGPENEWNNDAIGTKLRDIRFDFPKSEQALEASSLLAFYLTQIPGDHRDEVLSLCDEVTLKAPNSWSCWLSNLARMATWGQQKVENINTLDSALNAFNQTNGVELSRNPDKKLALKAVIGHWPPAPNDFTDPINAVITQQALILNKYVLAAKHYSMIVDQETKVQSETSIKRYIKNHPEVVTDPPKDQAKEPETVKSPQPVEKSVDIPAVQQDAQPIPSKPPQRKIDKSILWLVWSVAVMAGSVFVWLALKKRK